LVAAGGVEIPSSIHEAPPLFPPFCVRRPAWSVTITSMLLLAGWSFNPHCSRSAVNSDVENSSTCAPPPGTGLPELKLKLHGVFAGESVLSTTRRPRFAIGVESHVRYHPHLGSFQHHSRRPEERAAARTCRICTAGRSVASIALPVKRLDLR